MVEAVKRNFPQREIADAALRAAAGDRRAAAHRRRRQRATATATTTQLAILRIDPALERKQIDRVQAVARAPRARRRRGRARRAAGGRGAATSANLMPQLLDARARHATEGEIVEALQDVFGSYTETPVF